MAFLPCHPLFPSISPCTHLHTLIIINTCQRTIAPGLEKENGMSRLQKPQIIHSFTLLFSFMIIAKETVGVPGCLPTDSGPVVPTTTLVSFLELVQEAALQTFGAKDFDPKLFVDMSMKQNLTITSEAFRKMTGNSNGSISAKNLNGFLAEYLKGVDYVEPVDFVHEPDGFLPKVEDSKVRGWALEVHSLWKNLSRKVSDLVLENPELYTLLPLQKPVIIPGSIFREVYYWDSYWVIRGLLVSKMYETAKGIVNNLISLIDEYGYVLNGGRAYYTNRRNGTDFITLSATSIVPVDLNAFILKMEADIAFLANILGENRVAQRFTEAALARKKAIISVFWHEEKGQWLDYWLIQNNSSEVVHQWEASNQNHNIYASNFIPMWINLFHSDVTIMVKAIQSFQKSGFLFAAGIATSLTRSEQQWDFPNGWAPLQHMIVEGLTTYGTQESRTLAEDIASRWIRTNYVSYEKTGKMYEKYNVEECGAYGENDPQPGFGWSNGVVLAFLEEFGWPQGLKVECN